MKRDVEGHYHCGYFRSNSTRKTRGNASVALFSVALFEIPHIAFKISELDT